MRRAFPSVEREVHLRERILGAELAHGLLVPRARVAHERHGADQSVQVLFCVDDG